MSRQATTRAPQQTAMPPNLAGGVLQRKCACGTHTIAGGDCDACQKENASSTLQRAAVNAESVDEVPAIVHDVLRSSGQPLDIETRTLMEQRFGHDFSQVRVHTDGQAAESARAVNALAYTVGRNVVFGAGQHAPRTEAGRRLLAHELTHVAQQSHSAAMLQPAAVNSPDGADEREAEAVSQQIVAGVPLTLPHVPAASPLQRKMLNKVETDFQPGAKACVVHLHGEEKTALAVAKEIRSRRCVNLVHLDTTQRYIQFEIDAAGKKHICEADPNRVFSDTGLKKHALTDMGCCLATDTDCLGSDKARQKNRTDGQTDVKNAAVTEMDGFVKNEWGKKISQCRGGQGPSVTDGTLPLLAIHNNEVHKDKDNKPVSLMESYKKAAEKGSRIPDDPAKAGKKLPNPSVKAGEGINDFFFVTDPQDFKALSATRTVLLQADPVPASEEDGSLSVAMQHQRFITVEKEGRQHDKPVPKGGFKYHDQVYMKNYAMAAEALDQFGVADGPCPPAAKQRPSYWRRLIDQINAHEEEHAREQAVQQAENLKTDDPVLDREPPPVDKPKDCLLFESQSEIDAQKMAWKQKLGRMPLDDIISWIIGGPKAPPKEASLEVDKQQTCMIDAMAAKKKLPKFRTKSDIIQSGLRTYDKQEKDIWMKKFKFDFGKFGHISDVARAKCGTDIDAADIEWQPSKPNHKKCWGSLTGEEKEKEILMTSSAPGVSRHHAGTDFDFGRSDKDLEPAAWTNKGDFADAHRWLVRNASRYGFIQPFMTKGGYGKGYTAERWHWSYYPIAQALFEFAKEHQAEIDQALQSHWQDKGTIKPEYQFISKHWRDYLFNVETKPRF